MYSPLCTKYKKNTNALKYKCQIMEICMGNHSRRKTYKMPINIHKLTKNIGKIKKNMKWP